MAREKGETQSESQILSAIRKRLGREPDVVLWRLSQGGAMTRGGQTYRAGLSVNGASDLIGVLTIATSTARGGPLGRFIAFEVKSPRGAVRPEQTMFLDLVRRMGGFAAVVRSEAEAVAALDRARRGESE